MQLVSGALGVLLGSTCPPATCTHTLTPMSAVAVLTVDESFVLVNSGLKVPVLELSIHTVGSTAASKLPLLCARAIDAESVAIANTSTDFLMVSSSFLTFDTTCLLP